MICRNVGPWEVQSRAEPQHGWQCKRHTYSNQFVWSDPDINVNAPGVGAVIDSPRFFKGWCTHISIAVWTVNGLQLTPHQFHRPTHRHTHTHTHTHTQKCPQTRKEWSFQSDWSIVNGWLGIIDPHLSLNWGHLCRTMYAPEPPVHQASTRPHCDYILAQFSPLFLLHLPHSLIVLSWRTSPH